MKNKLISISLLLVLFGIMSSASAATYKDTYNPRDIKLSSKATSGFASSISWEFNILSDGYTPSPFEEVTSAKIKLFLRDDSNRPDWRSRDFFEVAHLDVGSNSFDWEVDTGKKKFNLSSLMVLSNTGKLSVTLTALSYDIFGFQLESDFWFRKAVLKAYTTVTPPVSSVPAPSALFLMGSGLIGIATATRSKSKKA